jgi:hypothetical protein
MTTPAPHHRRARRGAGLPLIAALALAAFPSAADAGPRETKYDVTLEITRSDAWSSEMRSSTRCGDDGGRCDLEEIGSGSTRMVLRTPTPQRVSVTSGMRGTPPMIIHSIDSGIPLKGSFKRAGSFTGTYSGFWDAANEDFAAETADCGERSVRTDVALGWKAKDQLQPILGWSEPLECPTGPTEGFTYEGDPPALMDVIGDVSQSKFGRTKQFRVSASRTYRGSIEPIDRTEPDGFYRKSGQSETTITWEATFRMVPKKKTRRR